MKIFQSLKSGSKNIKEFSQILKIEKQIKNNFFESYSEFVQNIRNIFSSYFISFAYSPEKYSKMFEISEYFESIIKEYEKKIFVKNSKNLIDIKKKLNKLKRNFKYTMNENSLNSCSNNKFRISFYDDDPILSPKKKNKNSLKNYKIYISNQMKALSIDQKKEIIKIISNTYLNKNNANNIYEIDINKMNYNQLKAIDNFINQGENEYSNCENNSFEKGVVSKANQDFNELNNLEQKKKQILEDDDLSESLSDEDDESSSNEFE